MGKKLALFVMMVLSLTLLLPVTAGADMGPKPSVVVEFTGLEGETYYATLLSTETHYGPWSVEDTYQDYYDAREGWDAFKAYEDPNGFYFIGYFEECTDTQSFAWTYLPPETFKVLLYFPETDSYAVTPERYERYAFDSYFTLSAMAPEETGTTEYLGALQKNYPYGWESFNLLVRVVLTLAVEVALALAFGFRAKKQLQVIVTTNLVTQILLNLALNLRNYHGGPFMLIFFYALMELVVFLVEGTVYSKTLKKYAPPSDTRRHPWVYALAANGFSFVLGWIIAHWVPGFF